MPINRHPQRLSDLQQRTPTQNGQSSGLQVGAPPDPPVPPPVPPVPVTGSHAVPAVFLR
jgi:hypothetical protein